MLSQAVTSCRWLFGLVKGTCEPHRMAKSGCVRIVFTPVSHCEGCSSGARYEHVRPPPACASSDFWLPCLLYSWATSRVQLTAGVTVETAPYAEIGPILHPENGRPSHVFLPKDFALACMVGRACSLLQVGTIAGVLYAGVPSSDAVKMWAAV